MVELRNSSGDDSILNFRDRCYSYMLFLETPIKQVCSKKDYIRWCGYSIINIIDSSSINEDEMMSIYEEKICDGKDFVTMYECMNFFCKNLKKLEKKKEKDAELNNSEKYSKNLK